MTDRDLLLALIAKVDETKDKVHNMEVSVVKSLSDIHLVQQSQEVNLKEHMQRTELNEIKLEKFEKDIKPVLESLRFIKWIFAGLSFLISVLMVYTKFKK